MPFDSQKITFIKKAPSIIQRFQERKGNWVTPGQYCQYIKEDEVHYYGIHRKEQPIKAISEQTCLAIQKLYKSIKEHLLEKMERPSNTKVTQFVGDCSVVFSIEGTEKVKKFLSKNLSKDCVILYGYTGIAENSGARCANAAVTDVINEKGMQEQVIANVVGFDTLRALKDWGCTGPELKYYIIVYGDDETCQENGTVFGDDIITSDFFADRLCMLDGGAQSFRQAYHALLLGQKITVLSGSRDVAKTSVIEFIEENSSNCKVQTPYFNASQFLQDMIVFISDAEKDVCEVDLRYWYNNYFGRGKCYVGDPKNKVLANARKELIDKTWDLFLKNKLYLRIKDLVQIQSN